MAIERRRAYRLGGGGGDGHDRARYHASQPRAQIFVLDG
jgi:hypothetical protein